jgi:pSer/pThr/pTyr-binding forkhead associated (FHA) protein
MIDIPSGIAYKEPEGEMARLLIKSEGFNDRVLELRLGVNRLGRSRDNDFQVEHSTISACHCELQVEDGQVVVRDCHSTNGTFVGGQLIQEARLDVGESFQIGDIELLVENTDVEVAIPNFTVKPHIEPPVVLEDGKVLCARHSGALVTHQCTFCRELMCGRCVKRLKRRGGKLLQLCPICSHNVVSLTKETRKRGLMDFLNKTVKLSFLHSGKSDDENAG